MSVDEGHYVVAIPKFQPSTLVSTCDFSIQTYAMPVICVPRLAAQHNILEHTSMTLYGIWEGRNVAETKALGHEKMRIISEVKTNI
jgi:hypothetical protein